MKKIILIYSKFLKRKKLSYFLKYKTNTLFKKLINQKNKNKKKNVLLKKININKIKVHDRLFNDSILKQEMLDNLLNKYLIYEEEKYPFYPKINHYINENTDKNILISSERNLRPKSYNNNFIKNDFSSYFNKYIQNTRIRKRFGSNSTSSFSCSNLNYNYSDLNDFYNDNNNYRYMPINKKQIKKSSIPISTKYKNKLYNSLFNDEDKDDIFKDTYNNSNKCSLNKTSYSFYPKLSNGNNKNKNLNFNNNPPPNINYIVSNNDFQKIKKELKKKNDNKNKNNLKKNIILEKSEKFSEKDKKIIHISDGDISLKEELNNLNNNLISKNNNLIKNISSINKNNNNTSLNNISSIAGSIKKENEKEKNSKINSPDKKEHLFSFGSDLFSIENKNNHSKTIINKSLIEKLQKKDYSSFINERRNNNNNNKIINRNNNKMKPISSSIRTKSNLNSNHISTNFTGNNSLYNINNYNPKNGNEKINNNKYEIESTNQYYIINEKNEDLKNNGLNFETTIQTLSDSKIFDLAKEYISEDDSLESYRKKNIISNRKKSCSSIYNIENNNNSKIK